MQNIFFGNKMVQDGLIEGPPLFQMVIGVRWAAPATTETMLYLRGLLALDAVWAQISHGRYGSASEVVRAGLRQLEDNETRLAALRAALADGENSGASTAFDVDAFLKAKRKNVAVKAAAN